MKPFRGQVISVKMEKTAIVAVSKTKIHPLYAKRVKRVKKYHVHDPIGTSVGDQVEFIPVRPISKTKKWVITKVFGQEKKEGKVVKKTKIRKAGQR